MHEYFLLAQELHLARNSWLAPVSVGYRLKDVLYRTRHQACSKSLGSWKNFRGRVLRELLEISRNVSSSGRELFHFIERPVRRVQQRPYRRGVAWICRSPDTYGKCRHFAVFRQKFANSLPP